MADLVQYVSPVLPVDVTEAALALEAGGHLERLVTRGALLPAQRTRLAKIPMLRGFSRRPASPIRSTHLAAFWRADLVESIARRRGDTRVVALDKSFAWLDERAAELLTPRTDAVLAREDTAQAVLAAAKTRGIATLYQLPTAFYRTVRELMEREAAMFPGACTSVSEPDEYAVTRCERKDRELALADYVLCHCAFVRESVVRTGFSPERIRTIPFGIDAERWSVGPARKEKMFLYVGNISLRKGVHRLLKAWKALGAHRAFKLRLIGDMQLLPSFLKDYQGIYEHIPRVPREELLRHYQAASAFVFNSVADGFGHVFGEAMACGTAVLCSRNSGAPELVTDGVEGRLFNYGDDEQLSSVLDWALTRPDTLQEMGRAARVRAENSPWQQFGDSLIQWIRQVERR